MCAVIEGERRHVKLADDALLVFDCADAKWRCAVYRRRRHAERGHDVTQARFDWLVLQRLLPKSYRTGWCRFVAFERDLPRGIRDAMSRAGIAESAEEAIDYITSMGWDGNSD